MKHLALFKCLIVSLLLTGCNSNTTQDEPNINETETKAKSTETIQLVKENKFIDFDVNKVIDNFAADVQNKIPEEEVHKYKAALYRFYSHVTSDDNGYTCDLKSGAEINVSENVFNALMQNLKETNEGIAQMKAKGMSVNVAQVNEAYLNSLLK